MLPTKYIVYKHAGYIFPAHVNHADFAIKMEVDFTKINSAGFITFGQEGLVCYGRSISLEITSRDEDSKIMNKMLNEI